MRGNWRVAIFGAIAVISALVPSVARAQTEPTQRVSKGGAPDIGTGDIDFDGYVRVVDGDTVEIFYSGDRVTVGFIGFDAPPANTPCGARAADALSGLLDDGVSLREDIQIGFDARYRRMYYASTRSGGAIARRLVKRGLVRADGTGRRRNKLERLMAKAKASRTGCLWSHPRARSSYSARQAFAHKLTNAYTHRSVMSASAASNLPFGFVDEVSASGLTAPTSFTFLPDGRALIAEKSGTVHIVEDGDVRTFIDIQDQVNAYYDRGLLDVAVDPDFENNGFVYLLYTYEDDATEFEGPKTGRLSRFTSDGEEADPATEEVIVGSSNGAGCSVFASGADCLPSEAVSHTVGGVRFADDGTLFMTTGDAASFNTVNSAALRTQDLDSLSGKVLHVTADGEGLESNPFYDGDLDSNRSRIWAYGVRNAYRFDLLNGEIPYVGDVGWDTWEEINRVPAGSNLGWPCYEGSARQAGYEPFEVCQSLYEEGDDAVESPLVEYSHQGHGQAVTGGAFYTGNSYPEEYEGAFFYGDYVQSWLKYLPADSDGEPDSTPESFAVGAEGPVKIGSGPDGDIFYLAINTGELHRIVYTGAGSALGFASPVDYPAGTNPHSVATIDLDKDGNLDLVAGNASSSNASVLLGDGAGGFGKPAQFAAAGHVKYALPVDLDDDGSTDIVTANESTDNIGVMMGHDGASFASPATYPACSRPHEVMAGDLNGDGSPDLVVPCWNGSVVSVLLSEGDGTFAPAVNYASGSSPHSVAIEDFNEDGDLDVAVANHGGSSLALLEGNGNGTLRAPVAFATGSGPHEVRSGYFDGDGHVDLASANDFSSTVSVLLGDGNGDFTEAVNYPAGNAPVSLAVADYDDDGTDDLATADSGGYPNPSAPTSIGVFLANGDGTFAAVTKFEAGPHPFSVAAGDFNSDGQVDLVSANHNAGNDLSVHINRSAGSPPPPHAGSLRYLSDLDELTATNGWGPVEKDRSNGEQSANDGQQIRLAGVRYAKGLGTHSGSEIVYIVPDDCTSFVSDVGIDDEVGTQGSAELKVLVDGQQEFGSGVLTGSSATKRVSVDVVEGQELRLVVTDGNNGITFDHADWAGARFVCLNEPPIATITSPSSTLKYAVGDEILFSGEADDAEDGEIPSDSLRWRVLIKHCPSGDCHVHILRTFTGSGDSFVVPDHGDDSYIELELKAFDTSGGIDIDTLRLDPQMVRLTLTTAPSGLHLVYDGTSVTAPFTKMTVVGSGHTIAAPSPQGAATFISWSDSGAQQHPISIGTSNAVYTATYTGATGGGGGGGGGGGSGGPSGEDPSPTPSPDASGSPPEAEPLTVVRHSRALVFHLGGHLVAKGHVVVEDGKRFCSKRVPVKIKRNGRVIARTRTNTEGAFRIRLRDRPGRYVAITPPLQIEDTSVHVCLEARSAREQPAPISHRR